MADANETITDIIKNIRAEADRIEESARGSLKTGESWPGRPFTESDLESALDLAETKRKEADRLEAALRRERGDGAKLRDTLQKVANAAAEIMERVRHKDGLAFNTANYIAGIAKDALAAPPRNVDLYATADEALKAQEQMFDESNFANGECNLGCPECDNPRVGCKIAWLFAPATEMKGGNNV